MSLLRLILTFLAAAAALVTALYLLAAGNPAVWTLMLVGLVILVNLAWLIWLRRNPRPSAGGVAPGWISVAGFSLSKVRIAVAVVAALFLAIPGVSLMSAFVIFPLAFFAILALIANFAPVAILAGSALTRLGLRLDLSPLVEAWVYCGIIWIGCAYGLARWGDAGAAIGGKNLPYLEVLFAPYVLLMGHRVG